jgi:excisionase family DNA binding protein
MMTNTIHRISDLVTPSPRDTQLAAESSRRLVSLLRRKAKLSLRAFAGRKEETIEIPRSAFRLLSDILTEMAKGNAVTFIPVHAELTTQQAADYLNVSRPYLIDLLEKGIISFHKVGTHRRILFKDLVEYKTQIDKKRLQALEALSQVDQELGLGY